MSKTAFLFLFLVLACCKSPYENTSATAPYFSYTDTNNNVYHISRNQLNYTPITPQQSSSGFFDGGTSKTVGLSRTDYSRIKTLLENVKFGKENHRPERTKKTAVLKISSKDSVQEQYILGPSLDLEELDCLLVELLK